MTTKTLIVLCLALQSSRIVVSQHQSCLTPDNKPGQCIPLRDCSRLYNMMLRVIRHKGSTFQEAVDQHLRLSQCGLEDDQEPILPLVCCSVPRDPPDVSMHANIHLINHELCGPAGSDKVVNGQPVGLTQYRWMVLLAYRMEGGRVSFRCGGTLINERYVLTAAHCLTDEKDLVYVRLGEYDTSKERDCEENEDEKEEDFCLDPYLNVGVEKKIRHPDYISTPLGSDVGLIRLNQTVPINTSSISTICLPVGTNKTNFNGKNMTVTGWGYTEKGQPSNVLLKADIPVQRNDDCHAFYKSLHNYTVDETMICAGNHRDSCRGDSGGPLQMISGVRVFQYGIVSYGPKKCGETDAPGVYTKVSYYMDWILDNME